MINIRIGIVKKLFFLTTSLCMVILISIFFFQTFFFKQHYINRKVDDITTNISLFQERYLEYRGDNAAIQRMEYDFLRNHNAWITVLDFNGNIKYADDFYFEVEIELINITDSGDRAQSNSIKIPLYFFINLEDLPQRNEDWLHLIGADISLFGLERENGFIPVNMTISYSSLEEEFDNIIHLENRVLMKDRSVFEVRGNGVITNVHLPDRGQISSWIYETPLFLELIQQFQQEIILNEKMTPLPSSFFEYERNRVEYKIFIEPIEEKNGRISYIFAVISLQPVDEAIQMIQDYYIYIIIAVIILTSLVSFYYSEKIVKPILKINKVTKQIVDFDFSEKIKVASKDEIGDLSRNINQLSDTLYVHIQKLQQDVEKERALETTRKEFISNVSHELKTPISVMKSCISILKDEVVPQKRDYYFQAMEKEVDTMNELIGEMLELAKLESGTYKMNLNNFYLDQIIDEILEKLLIEIEKKELKLETWLLPIQVNANQRYIEQVFINFMNNAISYTPKGGKLIISIILEMDKVKITVENKGAQIPDEQLEKVWESFYRGDSSRKRTEGGTGLGLAISKKILEIHHTSYGVKNTIDGVLFYFYLPINEFEEKNGG